MSGTGTAAGEPTRDDASAGRTDGAFSAHESAAHAHRGALFDRLARRTARVVVVGQGYVGLPVAMRSVAVGFTTIGFELDAGRLDALRAGASYVEDVASTELQRALEAGYTPTDRLGDLAGFDVAVISVPTPLREGVPDLTYVEDAARALARVLRAGALVVLESTTYPGTTEELVRPILEETGLRGGIDFFLGYSPERIDPGNAKYGFVNTPKVVSGIDADSLAAVDAFYGTLVDQTVAVGSPAEAELVKLLENTFRHVNIALVNELAMFASDLGVDIWRAIDAAATKPFGYMRFTPGPGVGGHCLPVDPSYLSWRVKRRSGRAFRFVELANDVNDHMPDHVAARVTALLNRQGRAVNGTRVLLLGLTYKAGTSDFRESPSLVVAERLLALGADLVACDEHVPDVARAALPCPLVPFGAEQVAAADLVVLLVDHPEFEPATIAREGQLVFDAKGVLRGHDFRGEVL
jgi:UDP-N-acetyl-D-mannosaminuronic acid dehydrogenase/UDP-N-acetyl-D-glucosamine dehydrogenase